MVAVAVAPEWLITEIGKKCYLPFMGVAKGDPRDPHSSPTKIIKDKKVKRAVPRTVTKGKRSQW